MIIKLDPGAYMPVRAHRTDAGLDLISPKSFVIPAQASYTVDTGVHVELPEGYVGMLKSKSGLNVKHSITSEGVIDEGYTGSIIVKLYNHGLNPVSITEGQKITQLVIIPYIAPIIEIGELRETERGSGGFGSTGK